MLELLTPIHPKLVHFPIALFITALGLDIASLIFRKKEFHQSAIYLYVGAALLTPLVVRTGIWEAERLHLSHPLLTKHSVTAQRTMWVALMSLPVLWFIGKEFTKYFRILFLVVLLALAGLVTYAGHLGGQMVYEYGVGVES